MAIKMATRTKLAVCLAVLFAAALLAASVASAAELPRRMLPVVLWRRGFSCCFSACRGACAPARQSSLALLLSMSCLLAVEATCMPHSELVSALQVSPGPRAS